MIDAALRLVTVAGRSDRRWCRWRQRHTRTHGQPATVASSNDTVLRMDNDSIKR